MAVLWEFLSYAAIGAVAGFFAGLLGIGGGAITGPLLIIVYSRLGFAAEHITHIAVATASASIVFIAPVAALTHARHGNVDWYLARLIGIGVMLGAFIGAYSASVVPPQLLIVLLSTFLFFVGINNLLFSKGNKNNQCETSTASHLRARELLPVAGGCGIISALLGIGGGAFMVPYLQYRRVFIRRAIGTSSFIGLPLATAATIGYMLGGSEIENLPDASIGYVYLPALISVVLSSVAFAYLGARLTNKLPAAVLRKIFACMVLTIALRLLWKIL